MPQDSPFDRDALRRLREPSITSLNRVPIAECGEPLLSLRDECPMLLHEAPLPWARSSVCERLRAAADLIPAGTRLMVSAAMRTLDMQAAAWETYRAHLRELHPDWPTGVLHRETNRFLHPPHAACPPGHTTGGAVDVRLVDESGGELEGFRQPLGGGHLLWRTFSPQVPESSRTLRRALYDAMVTVGFTNCYDEWWHYSWGDSGWAMRGGSGAACYGLVGEELYPAAMRDAVARLRAEGTLTRLTRRLAE